MQRYRHYGTSYSSSPSSSVPVEEVHAEEEVYEEEPEPLIEEEPVVQETGRTGVWIDLVWFGLSSYLAWFGLVWLGGGNEEEEVPLTKEEERPVVEEAGRNGLAWIGLVCHGYEE